MVFKVTPSSKPFFTDVEFDQTSYPIDSPPEAKGIPNQHMGIRQSVASRVENRAIPETNVKENSRLQTFDDFLASGRLNSNRRAVYGHPLDHFRRVSAIKAVVAECTDPEVRHALEMIADKIARLIETPSHADSAMDIAGYARCIPMIFDERERRVGKESK